MSTLAERQTAFLRAIHDDRAPLPDGWGNSQAAGMAVYRGNYRSALMGVLADVYERTARYVGEGPFRQASMHHVITRPPSGWTIDDAGAGFDQTCAQLFGNNPEVAELAWLEWTMRELATAPNAAPLSPADFAAASAEFGDAQWTEMRLALFPRAAARLVTHDLDGMWRALADDAQSEALAETRLEEAMTCLAWREGEKPTFIMADRDHAPAFAAIKAGGTYADMIAAIIEPGDAADAAEGAEPGPESIEQAAMRAGGIIGQWLNEGLITAINPRPAA